MKYTRQAFDRAEAEIAGRRRQAEEEYAARSEEIRRKAPEIYNLDKSIAAANYALISAIAKGGGREAVRQSVAETRKKNLSAQQTVRSMLGAFGYDEDYLDVHYYCEKCRDSGYHDGERCECMEKLLKSYTTRELNENCSIRLHDFSEFREDYYPADGFDKVNAREHMKAVCNDCRQYVKNFDEDSPSLFMFGKTGLGKTFLSSCIAKALLEEGRNVFFGSLLKLLRQIEDERFRRREGDTTGVVISAELVILDDLGSEFQTTFTDSVLYEIINERINLERPTIISTNLSPKELDAKYNDRLVSRLMGCFSPMMFVGNDVRAQKRRER